MKVTGNVIMDLAKKHAICFAVVILQNGTKEIDSKIYFGKPQDVAREAFAEYDTQASERKYGSPRADYAVMNLFVTGRKEPVRIDSEKHTEILWFEPTKVEDIVSRPNAQFFQCSTY